MCIQQPKNHSRPDIRLICIDIDGTLLDSSHRIPPENQEAVRYAAERGIVISLLTARPPDATIPIQRELGISGPLAFYGGGLLEYQGKRLCDRRVSSQTAELLIQKCAACGIHLSIYRDKEWYIAQNDMWSRQEASITGMIPTCTELKALVADWGNQGAHKLLCMGEPEQLNKLSRSLEKQSLSVQMIRSKETYLEIIPEGGGKAEAMMLLCNELGITSFQVMALGDHDLDVSMLRAAGFGVAMANSSAAARNAARYHTDSNDNAGVAKAIHHAMNGSL